MSSLTVHFLNSSSKRQSQVGLFVLRFTVVYKTNSRVARTIYLERSCVKVKTREEKKKRKEIN